MGGVSRTARSASLRHHRDMAIQVVNYSLEGSKSMLIRYWQPWSEVDTIRQQLDRALNEFASASHELTSWAPVIELQDIGDALVLRVQLPGVLPEAVDVQVARKGIVIAGESTAPTAIADTKYYQSEFRYGKFKRVITLPVAVENESVTADFSHGILTLTLPKVVEARNKVVKVNLAALSQTHAPVDTSTDAMPAVDTTPDKTKAETTAETAEESVW